MRCTGCDSKTCSNGGSNGGSNNSGSSRYVGGGWLEQAVWWLLEPYTDDSGSLRSIVKGFGIFVVSGTILGLTIPQNKDIPSPTWRILSSIIGYVSTICWNISWYPQLYLNYRLQSAAGVSLDAWSLDGVGYICYTIYTIELFANPSIRREYELERGETITVQSNDVLFAVHSLVLAMVWVLQTVYYEGFQGMSNRTIFFMSVVFLTCSFVAILAGSQVNVGNWLLMASDGVGRSAMTVTWLDFLYVLSFFRTVITAIIYVPQVYLNYQRKSTGGYIIWNVTLAMTGGVLSMVQAVGDAIAVGESSWTVALFGNYVKFAIASVNIFFNIILLFQHYVLYGTLPKYCNEEGELYEVIA